MVRSDVFYLTKSLKLKYKKQAGDIDVLQRRVFVSTMGVVSIGSLRFTRQCEAMVLEFICSGIGCDGKVVNSLQFSVGKTNSSEPQVQPPPVIHAAMTLRSFNGTTSTEAQAQFRSFLQSVNASIFEDQIAITLRKTLQFVKNTTLLYCCGLPARRAKLGITSVDRSGTSPDGGYCYNFVSNSSGNNSTQSYRWLQVLASGNEIQAKAEFEIEFTPTPFSEAILISAITDVVVQELNDPNSQLRSNELFSTAVATGFTSM